MTDDPKEAEPEKAPPSEGDAQWREQTQRSQDEHAPAPPPPRGTDPRDNHP